MPSSYTASLRFTLQATGENIGTWGQLLNAQTIAQIDQAIAGVTTLSVSGAVTLTSLNGQTDQARSAMIYVTGGSGGSITVPAVTKLYTVLNTASGAVTIGAGGTTVSVSSGCAANVAIAADGTALLVSSTEFGGKRLQNVGYPVSNTDGANAQYVQDLVAQEVSTGFPSQTGNQNRFLGTNGTTVNWMDPLPDQTNAANKVLRSSGTARTGAYWDFLPGTLVTGVTSPSYTITAADCTHLLEVNVASGSSIGLPLLSGLNGRFMVLIKNVGAPFEADPQPGNTIAGQALGCPMPTNEMRMFVSDGNANFGTYVLQPYDMTLTATSNLRVGPGYTRHVGMLYAGGGPGYGGGASAYGPPGGGGGGGAVPFDIPAATFGLQQTITVASSTPGLSGNVSPTTGAQSSIGSIVTAYGGASVIGGGGGGGGALGPGAGATGGVGGGAFSGGNASQAASYGGGGGGANGANGGTSVYGGGGGGSTGTAGGSVFGGGGGAGSTTSSNGGDGIAPGGGGGGSMTGTGGAGARGECRIRGVV